MQSKYKVYLIDDDEDDLELLNQAFSEAEYTSQIDSFTSPTSLLIQLKLLDEKDLPDIIIMDHHMPLMDGSDVVKIIRKMKKFQDTAIAIYSTQVQENKIEQLLSIGVDYFLPKASSFAKIKEHVKVFFDVIDKKQSESRK